MNVIRDGNMLVLNPNWGQPGSPWSDGAGLDLHGTDGSDILSGGSGDDTLAGGAGDDTLTGLDGHDYLSGGDGNDVIDAGHGVNWVDGGPGDDVFLSSRSDFMTRYFFNKGDGVDRIISPAYGLDFKFGPGIAASDIAPVIGSSSMRFTYANANGASDAFVIESQYSGIGGADGIMLYFADNTAVRLADLIMNAPVVFRPVFEFDIPEGQFGGSSFVHNFLDFDSEVLRYDLRMKDGSAHSAWINLDSNKDELSISPSHHDAGKYALVLTATDPTGLSVSADYLVNIEERNAFPRPGTPMQDQQAEAELPFSLVLPSTLFSDADDDGAGVMRVDALPSWLHFDAASRTLSGVAPWPSTEHIPIKIIFTDSGGANASSSFFLTVTEPAQTEQFGTPQADRLSGRSNSDRLWGLDGDDQLFGMAHDDYLNGGNGNDLLDGGSGTSLLQGGAGNDALLSTGGGRLLQDGGSGDDRLLGGDDVRMAIGGAGADTIMGGGAVIAFNRGDGRDTVAMGDSLLGDTLSLGGGLTYADLVLRKSGSDLVLSSGTADQITFKGWYASAYHTGVATLQMVTAASWDYNPQALSPITDNKVEQFDFRALMARFDEIRASGATAWSIWTTLEQFHLGGSDTAAIGGDLAYQYALNGSLSNIGMTTAIGIVGSAAFGTAGQLLLDPASLNDGSPLLS
ncbi:hypothetical protein F2P45_03560 [Massilia sp. CCM 8733]|uniref:Dystroglycan-type cadherin-like domain-containing protein n=1 Tax=Massilia mucilaginosa TaxID=2609282 RepID=A0ABX0NMR1_9BURK|nr:putative Ig domain-containing protein [Massilia mucilaginosa]NHZ88104.1 hypothetical protein [Massilia mucilaginosa]